jgi:hypothetical protein
MVRLLNVVTNADPLFRAIAHIGCGATAGGLLTIQSGARPGCVAVPCGAMNKHAWNHNNPVHYD